MKIFKNPIFMFILGSIIFLGIGVYAGTKIQAADVEYSQNISVKDKIDDLYTKVKPKYNGITTVTPSTTIQTLPTAGKYLSNDITIGSISYDIAASKISESHSGGPRITNRSTSLSLKAGNYLVFASSSMISNQSNLVSNTSDYQMPIQYSSGTCNHLIGKDNDYSGTNSITINNSAYYLRSRSRDSIIVCHFDTQTTLTAVPTVSTANYEYGQSVQLYAIKLD